MSSLRLWPIWIENPETHERMRCLGQGHTVSEALSDASKAILVPFRPKNDGKQREDPRAAVFLPDGTTLLRDLKEFER